MALVRKEPVDFVDRVTRLENAYGDALFYIDEANKVGIKVGIGAPSDGSLGTGVGVTAEGSEYIDRSSGIHYYQKPAITSPSWKAVTTA